MNNSANTIAALLPRSSTSGAGSSSAGNAPAIAARERQRRLQEHRQRQEHQSNLAWQTESLEHRLRAAQESYDVQMIQTLEQDRACSASLEATRRFFQFPSPRQIPNSTTPESRANEERVRNLLARFMATGECRKLPEVKIEDAAYFESREGSHYRRDIHRRVAEQERMYDEEQHRLEQERERRVRNRRTSSRGRFHQQRRNRRHRNNYDDYGNDRPRR